MKAFLMYRDRDFDPQQLLIRRDQEPRHRKGADEKLKQALQQALPWNEAALRQDLGLDVVFAAMSAGDSFLFEVAQLAILSSLTDVETIRYRQDVLVDALRHTSVVRDMYQMAIDALEADRKNYWGYLARYPSGIVSRAVEVLQAFVNILRKLRRAAEHADTFESEGFRRFFAMIRNELDDDYFDEIEEHLRQLKFRGGVLISAKLGRAHTGKDYVLRAPNRDTRSWLTRILSEKPPEYIFELHPRDEAGARAFGELRDRGLNLAGNAVAQAADHILSFFQMVRTELAFYIGCLQLHARLGERGLSTCLPRPVAAGERKLSFDGLYDASLALVSDRKIVSNAFDIDRRDLIIVTGANTGGKSTFLRSVGLACLMMQAGMFVPSESFSSEICGGLYTHYKREEDETMESGKWDEELSRMSEIVDHLKPNSLVLFNESFASTNEREGSEIAGQIVEALLDRNTKVLYVTHLYHFARALFLQRSSRVMFVRAERRPDGTRPFKLIEGEPLQTSYGEDLYKAIFQDDPRSRQRAPRHEATGG